MGDLQRILHVEDEPDIREIAAIGLGEIGGFTVESCGSPTEALERAAQLSDWVDLLLLDVMMPEMDGLALLGHLRKLDGLALTPAIFVTAKTDSREIAPLMDAGAIGVVAKPFDPMTVSDKIREIWKGHVGS